MDAWVVEVLQVGYQILFDRQPPLSERPLSLPAYSPQSIKGVALTQELQTFFKRGQSNQPPSLLVSTAVCSAILHKYGVRMLRYLDDWLILASSELACLQSRDRLLTVCTELGIQVNLTKSSLVPTQSLVYLGVEIRSLPLIARPTPARVGNLLRL